MLLDGPILVNPSFARRPHCGVTPEQIDAWEDAYDAIERAAAKAFDVTLAEIRGPVQRGRAAGDEVAAAWAREAIVLASVELAGISIWRVSGFTAENQSTLHHRLRRARTLRDRGGLFAARLGAMESLLLMRPAA
jgi:hypothetical protein